MILLGNINMRYWKHRYKDKVLAIDVQMAPINWEEVTKEQYEEAKNAGLTHNKNI